MSSDDEQVFPNVNGDPETPPTAVSRPSKAAAHPKYYDMLVEAIKALDEKKGASVIAIKHWIIQTYPELEQSRMKNLLRMAIKRGVDSGAIVRPKKSEAMGAALTGRYKLGKPPKPAKKAAEKKKKVEKKKAAAVGKKKIAKSPTAKKDRKESDHDIFDYEDDTEGSDPDGGKTPPPYRKNRAKKVPVEKSKSKKAVENRPRSSSANATPKPRVSKSRAIMRRSKSQSPAPSKIKKALKKPVSKSPAKKLKAKSPAKKPMSKSPAKKPKAKAATSKASPAATGKAKKPAAKKKDKTPTKKAVKTTKKKITK
eukprot:XP_784934.1 PREDICTED: histone H1-delta-like [Strongylocentrotus purpuratus]